MQLYLHKQAKRINPPEVYEDPKSSPLNVMVILYSFQDDQIHKDCIHQTIKITHLLAIASAAKRILEEKKNHEQQKIKIKEFKKKKNYT